MDTSSFDGSSSSSSTPSILPNPAGSYYFTIGSPETFERQLKEAQDELGIPSSERIPVTYKSQTAMSDWVISLAPTLLLIGFFAWSARKMSGGMGGGAGGANPFNVGKSKAKQFKWADFLSISCRAGRAA
jgi:AFG3 family protein